MTTGFGKYPVLKSDNARVIHDFYFNRSGNDTFLRTSWPKMVAIISYAVSRALDDGTQLYGAPTGATGIPLASEKGQALGCASTVSLVLGLERMAEMAVYLGDNASAVMYRTQAGMSRKAIDTLLWNATGGYYASTLGVAGYDVMDIAQVLLAEIGTLDQRLEFIQKLGSLQVPAGYINGTRYFDTPGIVNPYYMSFLLEGLAKTKHTELAQSLLDATWSPMVHRDNNYTGAYWEYIVSSSGLQSNLLTNLDRALTAPTRDWTSLLPKVISGVATRQYS